MSEQVKVAVRCRPLNQDESEQKMFEVVDVNEERREIFIKNPKKKGQK